MNCNKTLITDIVQCLKEKGLIDGGKEVDIKTALEELFCDRAFTEWWTQDVMAQLEDCGTDRISREDARKVLDYVMQEHDATVGINWEVIQMRAEHLADRGEITIEGYEPQCCE